MTMLYKSSLCLEILGLGAIGFVALSMQTHEPAVANPLPQPPQIQVGPAIAPSPQTIAQRPQRNNTARELTAFQRSRYDYWDARVLSRLWEQSVDESKLRIGRKIIFGTDAVLVLEQMLLDARTNYLQSIYLEETPANYVLYQESPYTYEDAVLLAKWWNGGTTTEEKIMESKYRIERNLALSNNEGLDSTLRMARRQYPR